jgi:hypothetical protein
MTGGAPPFAAQGLKYTRSIRPISKLDVDIDVNLIDYDKAVSYYDSDMEWS